MKPGDYTLRNGCFAGQTIDEIATRDKGLLFLDRLLGRVSVHSPLGQSLFAYLHDPPIANDLDTLLDDYHEVIF